MDKILIVVLLFSLTGCSSLPTVLKEAAYVSDEMMTGAPIDTIRSVKLSDIQTMQVNHAVAEYESFKLKWDALADNPDSLSRLSEEFRKDYSALRQHVVNIEQIVRTQWADYSPESKTRLAEYLSHVKKLDNAVNHFYMEKRYWDAAKTSLLVIATLVEVGTKIAP